MPAPRRNVLKPPARRIRRGSRLLRPAAVGVPTYPAVIGGIHPESNNRMGPFIDGNGNLYTVTELSVGDPRASMRKSTDGGLTWVEVDGANRPAHDDLESLWIVQRGTVLYLLAQRSGTMRVSHHTFNTSDAGASPDTWQLKDEVVHLPTTAPANQAVSLAVRSNGDLLAFYRTDPVSTFQRLAWRKKPSGGSWSAETQVDTTASTNFTQVAVVVGASDKVHIFYKNDTTSAVWHKSLDSADSLSASEIVNDNATTTDDQMMATPPVYVDVAGVERVYACWKRLSDGLLVGAAIDNDGVPSAEEAISSVAVWEDPAVVVSEQAVATLAADPATGRIHALYADNATHDLWQVTRTTTWGTPVEIADAVEAQLVAASVLTHSAPNGGGKVLGIVYDDNPTGAADAGVPKYTQVELVEPPPVHQSSTSIAGAAGRTNLSFTAPAGLVDDNIVEVGIFKENAAAITPPSGFTQKDQGATDDGVQLTVFWGRAPAVGAGPFNFTWTGATFAGGSAHRISGAILTGDPYDVTRLVAESGAGDANTPDVAVTTATANTLAVWHAAGFTGGSAWGPPASFAEILELQNYSAAWRTLTAAGASGAIVGTQTGSTDALVAWVGAFKPLAVGGGDQSIALADAGSSSQTITVAAAVGLADSASAAETLNVSQPITLSDSASAAEQLTVAAAVPLPEAGAASDARSVAATLAVADSGTASDAQAAAAAVPLAEAASAADSLAVSIPIALGEVGSAADALAVTVAAALADTGTASQALAITATVPLAQAGTAADAIVVDSSEQKPVTDAGAGSDAVAVAAAVPLAEVGAAADALAVAQTRALADAGTAADVLTVSQTKALADSGAASQALIVAAAVPLVDLGAAAENAAAAVLLALAETAAGSDALVVFVPPPVPPPRWVEGASSGSGQVEGAAAGAGQLEGALAGAGVVEGSSSV